MAQIPPMDEYSLCPIGRVRAPWKSCAEIPVQGGPAEIVVEAEFVDALDGVERGTHLIVIGWLHEADRKVLQARPRKLNAEAAACGVFACRAPVRPNPLSITVVELARREGAVLHVDPLDLMDGTPIVDIKSYSPGWDTVFAAQRNQRVPASALDDELLRAFLRRDVRNHVGPAWASLPAQAAIEGVFAAVRHFAVAPRDACFSATVGRLDLVTDALMAMLGASFASGRIGLDPALGRARIRFQCGAKHLDVALDDGE